MNTSRGLSIFIGAILIIGGILFLLANMNVIDVGSIFWGLILGVIGILFVVVVLQDKRQWWAWIPGLTLLSVGLLIILEETLPSTSFDLGGVIVPGGIGLSFLLIYLTSREHWWAIIPGGVMVSIATMIAFQSVLPANWEDAAVGVFFLGLGLTFLALTRVKTEKGQMKWPLIPGGILLAMGFLFIVLSSAEYLLPYFGAFALIVVGVFLLWRATRRREQ
jgi:uncharacterized membrane protein HdeD (DUF308 family)